MDDDNCKFCSMYMDPIGCDTRIEVNGGTWCGQCKEGRDALYGNWSIGSLSVLKDFVEKAYEADPIPRVYVEPPKNEEFIVRHKAHLKRLWLNDLYQTLERVLKDRSAMAKKTGALPPKGMKWTIGKTAGAIASVNGIAYDMTDRSGGDGFWDSIDEETKDEIKGKWAEIVMEAHGHGLKKNPKTGRTEVWEDGKKKGEQG